MDASQLASLTDHVRMLPAGSAHRDRWLQRLTDVSAVSEAAAALQAAATRLGGDAGPLAEALAAARAIWSGGRDEVRLLVDDTAARDQLRAVAVSRPFRSLVPGWIRELREVAVSRPDTGACTLASALQMWLWTMGHFQSGAHAHAESGATAVTELADALPALIAGRCLVLEIAARATDDRAPESRLRTDLCHVHAAHAAATTGALCAELVFGYRRHLVWDAEGCAACYGGDELDALEGLMPGIAGTARGFGDVVEADGTHAPKAGPCARIDGVETFARLRARLDGCLTGARLAKARAAAALARHVADHSPQHPAGGR